MRYGLFDGFYANKDGKPAAPLMGNIKNYDGGVEIQSPWLGRWITLITVFCTEYYVHL